MSKTGDKNLRVYQDDHDAIKHMAIDCGVSVKKFIGIMVNAVSGPELKNIQDIISKNKSSISYRRNKNFENTLPPELQSIIYGEGNVRTKN